MSLAVSDFLEKHVLTFDTNCYDVMQSSRVVSAKPWVVVAVMAMMCLMPYQSVDFTSLSEDSVKSESSGNSHEILLMGNSYVSFNSLHNLVDGVMNAASQPANVSTLNGGGMRLSQHWSNVASAGHQWNTTLNNGNWDWVVLQDQSQIPGFPRSQNEWIASKNGAVELAEVIEDNGGETVLMMTWGRRNGDSNNAWRFPDFSTMQDELESGYLDYRDNISTNGGNAWVAPVGLAFEHIHDKIVAEGGTPTNSGNTFYNLYTNDGSHPSLSGSYLAAVVLYATITGNDPVGLSHSTSLSNSLVLELQQAAAATVFNETSYLDYPWQTTNQNPNNASIIQSDFLAWDSIASYGGLSYQNGNDIVVSNSGDYFITGHTLRDFSMGGNCNSMHNVSTNYFLPFLAKFDKNSNCLWVLNADTLAGWVSSPTEIRQMDIDSLGNLYLMFAMIGNTGGLSASFGNATFTLSSSDQVYLAKINPTGNVEWISNRGEGDCPCLVTVDNHDDVVISLNTAGASTNFGLKIEKLDSSGSLLSTYNVGGAGIGQNYAFGYGLVTDSNYNIYMVGKYQNSVSFSSYSLSCQNCYSGYVAKFGTNLNMIWVEEVKSSTSSSSMNGIDLIDDNKIYVTGTFYSEIDLDGTIFSAGGNQYGLVAEINSTGDWQWGTEIACSCGVSTYDLELDSYNNLYIPGISRNTISSGGLQLPPAGAQNDGFILKLNSTGSVKWGKSFGGNNHDSFKSVYFDTNDKKLFVIGSFTGTATSGRFSVTSMDDDDVVIGILSGDYDGDDFTDELDDDDDGDFINDIVDSCHYSQIGFISTGSSDHDSDGCDDETEDFDDDNDLLNDTLDNCPKGMTDWIRTNASDLDDDGCMDALEDYDDDNDGFEDYEDYCSRIPGNSTFEFEKGCPDADGDGRPDILDPFKNDPTEWSDTDGDGVGDNSDAFPTDATQQYDTDGDTYGDEEFGNAGDSCPTVYGTSTIDRYGCLDTDGDGWSDEGDDFPDDPTEHLDTDGDEVPDHADDFPFDPTQQTDTDGDGYGDNANGNLGDAFPNDSTKHADSDRDGIDDDTDSFPYDPTQWEDADGDGMGDNPMGIGADKFPNDPTQWGDIDGDGYGDNITGNNPDAFPTDATQWSDIDGDGYGDNPAGRLYDLFPENPTQWEDDDGDGLGDNQSGTDADPYLNDFDNDGYNDTIDILPRLSSPGDLDNDGCLDEDDAFIDNALECLDTDGDGTGNNADADDDGDGWTDADESRAGTNPLDANDKPVDSFEIVIPGTQIGLGAWDLIGIFGGVPIFTWLAFGFVTRNKRCARFEEMLENANSRQELEQVALKWEYSLMLRLLGPHQGIRLERIRSELDDKFENAEMLMAAEEFEPMTEVEQAPIVDAEQKDLPFIDLQPSIDTAPDQTDEYGYSWLKYNGQNWYRGATDTEWTKHEE